MIQTQKHENLTQSPETIGLQRASAELEAFMGSPALSQILEGSGFDTSLAESTEKGEYIKFMLAFADEHWNARKNKERGDVQWGGKRAEQSEFYRQFVDLGMIESSRLTDDRYDFLLVLGGANLSPLQRLRYGLEQPADYKHIALLGAGRPVSKKEGECVAGYALGARTEYDLMDGAARTLFEGFLTADEPLPLHNTTPDSNPHHWKVNYFEAADGTQIFSLHSDYEVKDTRSGQNRAKTGDTYKFLRSLAGDMLTPETQIALVTNAVFTNAQRLDAVREITLQTGAPVEVIGFGAGYAGVTRTEGQVLQEIKAAISAADRLQAALELRM
jgi:hypothetical protein